MNYFSLRVTFNSNLNRLYLSIVLLVLASTMTYAQTTITWTGNTSQDWNEPSNWIPNIIPDANTDVTIPFLLSNPNTPIILDGVTAFAKSVTINTGGSLKIDISGRLEIANSTQDALISSGFLTNFGTIEIENAGRHGISVIGGDFINIKNSFINIKSITSSLNHGLFLGQNATLRNDTCAVFLNSRGSINNGGIIVNDGQMNLNTIQNHIIGDFTNNGVIEDVFGTFPTGSIINNELVFSGTTILDSSVTLNAFLVGINSKFDIVGVYTDINLVRVAGTYDKVTNSFTVDPNLSFGTYSFGVSVEDTIGGCLRHYIWKVDNRACSSTCFSVMDKCWSPIGNDKSWSNGNNWIPTGVPQSEDWVMIPTCAEIEYDYTGSDIPALIYVNDSAKMTVLDNHILSVQARTDSKVSFYLFTNRGNVINNGEINLSKTTRSGMANIGTFENYGDITVDSINITNVNAPPTNVIKNGIENSKDFINHSGASLVIKNSLANGFLNTGNLINQSGANIKVHDITNIGMDLRFGSTFENKSGGIIDIYNINNPSDKLIIRQGAEVIWNPSVDIQN